MKYEIEKNIIGRVYMVYVYQSVCNMSKYSSKTLICTYIFQVRFCVGLAISRIELKRISQEGTKFGHNIYLICIEAVQYRFINKKYYNIKSIKWDSISLELLTIQTNWRLVSKVGKLGYNYVLKRSETIFKENNITAFCSSRSTKNSSYDSIQFRRYCVLIFLYVI